MNQSLEFNQRVLKKIVFELIKNSNPKEFENNKIAVKERKEFGELEIIGAKKASKPTQLRSIESKENYLALPKRPQIKKLFIPETKLPAHLQYLRPQLSQISNEINFGRLASLIKDPGIKIIECAGANQEIQLSTISGQKNSGIFLSREEILQIIGEFSRETKIPFEEGVFRVVLGNLQLSAIISESLGSKFIIKKITFPNLPPYQTRKFTSVH